MFEIEAKKVTSLSGHKAAIYSLCPGFSSTTILSAGGDGWVVEWDLSNPGQGTLKGRVKNQLFSVAAHPNTGSILTGSMDGEIHLFKPGDPDSEREIHWHKKGLYDIVFWRDHLLTGGGQGILTKWEFPAMKPAASIAVSGKKIRSIAFHPSQPIAATGATDGSISIVHLDSFRLLHRLEAAHERAVFSLHYNNSGTKLFSGGMDAQLSAWNAQESYQHLQTIPAHMFTINSMAISPNGEFLATASRDKSVKIWDAESHKLLKVLDFYNVEGHVHSVNAVHWAQFENYLISAGDDRSLILWKIGKKQT